MTERKPTEVYTGTGALVPAVAGLIVLIPILKNFKDNIRHYTTDEFIIREVFYDGLVVVEELDSKQPRIEVLGIHCTIKGTTDSSTQQTPMEEIMTNATQQQDVDYSEMVAALAKPGAAICATLTPETAHDLHMAVGISGEAGELLDAVKKAAIYNKPLDRENVIEELGDLEFYMEGLRQRLGISREETLNHNVAKLSKRYAEKKYSDVAAQARADKQENAA